MMADWSQYRSVLLTLGRVPKDATTWDLYSCLSSLGKITYIAIDEDQRGERSSEEAQVRFEPPPAARILPGTQIKINVRGRRETWVHVVKTVPTPNEGAVRSPVQQNVAAKITLKPTKLTYGITTEPNVVMGMKSVESLGLPEDLSLMMDFARRRLVINFPVLTEAATQSGDTCEGHYRMETRFDALHHIYRVCNKDVKAVILAFDNPPRFYRQKNDVEQTHTSGKLTWGEHELWSRVVEIVHDPHDSSSFPASLANSHAEIDLGRWTVYWLDLDEVGQTQWAIIESALQDWNIKTKHDDTMQLVPRVDPQLWSWLEDIPATADNLALLASASHIDLPFDVRYQLEVCISHGVLEERNITRDFVLKLAELARTSTMSSNRARLVLEYAADQGKRIWNPMSLFEDRAAMTFYPITANIPHYCALVRKVTVTPTRIYFHSPTVETTNRVIRHFTRQEHFFLRVQFTDEQNEGRINGSDTIRDNELYVRAFRLMNNGIKMGRWHWHFLAFGNSQIRENGAFFFCEPVNAPADAVTCDKIRAWMGRFSHIRVPAKYAARLGQCFSTTRLLRGIPAPSIVNVPDEEQNGHCFTDGVGKMSPLLAQMVAEDWQLDTVPSACQFRMGGCKGLLVTWPEAKGLEVHIRKSQEKFHAEFNGLEIIRFSSFSVATLNRQTIAILSCLGVPDEVFVDLLLQQLANYDRAMKDRAYAVQLLQQYVDENQVTVGIARMLLDGFMETREPFVKAMMELWRSWSIKGLKEKARIVVDDGAFVFGCVDETRTLKGYVDKKRRRDAKPIDELPEIFLQISDPKARGAQRVITGVCLVGRNPSLHPGDIRVVNAVDVPSLRHLNDVVVFPMHGDQDIPSMCSGGDLDGDDYFVIWNQEMIPREWFHPPMDYAPPPPQELDRDPNVMDLKVFFSLYMKNNSLPIIAHAHVAQADNMDSGAKDPRCKCTIVFETAALLLITPNLSIGIELAKLHSKAVDYVKTGIPAIVEKALLPRKYPHFMEKKGKQAYHSKRILGQLYDRVATVNFAPDYELPFDDRILKQYKLENELLKKARRLKSQYDTAMRRIMGQMEIRTEFEILSTFVMSRPKVGTAYKLHEIVRREADALKTQFKEICIKEAGGSRDHKQLAPFVAAMYQVTAEEVRIALYEARTPHLLKNGRQGLREIKPESMPLISFPWLFDEVLGRIAKDSSGVHVSDEQAAVQVADTSHQPAHGVHVSNLENGPMANMDYARTADGRVIHRGEILRLFDLDGDDDNTEAGNDSSSVEDVQDGAERVPEIAPKRTYDFPVKDDESFPDVKTTTTPTELLASSQSTPATHSGDVDRLRSSPITRPHAGTSRTVEDKNLIKHPYLPPQSYHAGNSAPDRSELMKLAQRIKTIGPESPEEIHTSGLGFQPTVPMLSIPLGGMEGKTDAGPALDLGKASDGESEIEIEEVNIGVKNTASALEHLAKFSC